MDMNPTTLHSSPVKERIDKIAEAGVCLDEHMLVIPQWDRAVRHRLAPSLIDIRSRITEALQQEKHVLYVPGSYDLVHAGHVSYILQGIEAYLAKEGLSRDQLYVVALADDDELIRAVKPAHLQAIARDSKSQGNDHPRPIECEELFNFVTGSYSARLIDLASLPIDLVGFLPAPTNFKEILHDPLFTAWLNRARSIVHGNGAAPESEEQKHLDALLDRIQSGRFSEVLQDFQKTKFNLLASDEQPRWDVGSWQFLLHLFIGDVHRPSDNRPYVRMISEHDVKYKDVVAAKMRLCGIHPHFVNDTTVVSTTTLLEKYGWQTLYHAKQSHFTALEIIP
jgi:hypothetical protein